MMRTNVRPIERSTDAYEFHLDRGRNRLSIRTVAPLPSYVPAPDAFIVRREALAPGIDVLCDALARRETRLGALLVPRAVVESAGAHGDRVRTAEALVFAAARAANAPADPRDVRQLSLVRQVFAEIERTFRDGVALRDIAANVNMSPAHLTDTIRRTTGRPIQQWIIERRLTEARRLLVETDETVQRIAFACGFSDPAYFTRAFRARMQNAPERWRRTARAATAVTGGAWNRRSLLSMAERIATADDRTAIEAAAATSAVAALGMDYAHSARRDPATRLWITFPLAAHIAPLALSDDSEYMPSVAIGCTFVQDALSTSRFTHGRAISAEIGFETYVVVPHFADGVCVGGMAAFARRSRVLGADELEVAETIAACTALHIAERTHR